jgi:uncharacterized membrane protein
MSKLRFGLLQCTLVLHLLAPHGGSTTALLSHGGLGPVVSFRQQQPRRQENPYYDSARLLQTSAGAVLATSRISTKRSLLPPDIALPLVDAGDKWGNWGVLLGCAAASQSVGKATRIGRLLGPPVTAMALAFILASVGVISPGGTIAGKELQLLALQLATPLILLGASSSLNRKSIRQCGPLMMSFVLASVATVVACAIGWVIAGPCLTYAMGRDGLVIAAALMAKNIGGGVNYVAVCSALNASPNAMAAGLCVDNIFALLYFPATSMLAAGRPDVEDNASRETDTSTLNAVTVEGVSNAFFVSAALLWASERLSGGLPLCTLLALIVAGIAPPSFLRKLQPSSECLGTVALYAFFATAGAPGLSVAESAKAAIGPIGLFLVCLYSIHGMILVLTHKFLFLRHQDPSLFPQRLLVASSAAIGGPATAVALAQASKWDSLILPSLVVGNVGYAIATFAGLLYYAILHP